jgi:fructose-1-phosphate kinase PfkB-like protein
MLVLSKSLALSNRPIYFHKIVDLIQNLKYELILTNDATPSEMLIQRLELIKQNYNELEIY